MATKKRKVFILFVSDKEMQIKLLDKVVSEIAGKQASDILQLLVGKKDVNEFLIAKKLKLTINQIRNILYKLANFSLVTFTRKKDKRKGWYTYFWTLDVGKALDLLAEQLVKEIKNLENQLKSREIKRFYFCKTCKSEVSEETALLHDFSCPECGEVYELAESKKIIPSLKKQIDRLGRQRNDILSELEKIKEVKEKKRGRKEKKEKLKKKKKTKKKKLRKRKKVKKRKPKEKKAKRKMKKSIKVIKKMLKKAVKKRIK